MTKRLAARRYARAIFEIARERGELEKWQGDLAKIASLQKDEAALNWLGNPRADAGLKSQYIEQLGLGSLEQNLVHILLNRGRLHLVEDISEEYQRLAAAYHGLETAEVTTAVPLSDTEKQKLAAGLGAVTGKKVLIKAAVDPEIIGGMTARINDQLLDGSTRRRLLDLKKAISGGR